MRAHMHKAGVQIASRPNSSTQSQAANEENARLMRTGSRLEESCALTCLALVPPGALDPPTPDVATFKPPTAVAAFDPARPETPDMATFDPQTPDVETFDPQRPDVAALDPQRPDVAALDPPTPETPDVAAFDPPTPETPDVAIFDRPTADVGEQVCRRRGDGAGVARPCKPSTERLPLSMFCLM